MQSATTILETKHWHIRVYPDGSVYVRPMPDSYGLLFTGTEGKELAKELWLSGPDGIEATAARYFGEACEHASPRFVRPLN